MEKNRSLFVDFFGNYPIIRVLDFLIEMKVFDYSKKDIARNSAVSWNTLQNFWKEVEEKELVVFTRKVGKANMYKLNEKNPVVKQLVELDANLMKRSMELIGEKLKERAIA